MYAKLYQVEGFHMHEFSAVNMTGTSQSGSTTTEIITYLNGKDIYICIFFLHFHFYMDTMQRQISDNVSVQ